MSEEITVTQCLLEIPIKNGVLQTVAWIEEAKKGAMVRLNNKNWFIQETYSTHVQNDLSLGWLYRVGVK